MPFFNYLFIPVLLLALGLFAGGEFLCKKLPGRRRKLFLLCASILCAAPGSLMALYYLHLFGDTAWFYRFRAFPFSELTAAAAGFPAGVLAGFVAKRKEYRRLLILALVLGLAVPYVKMLQRPVQKSGWPDQWQDGVCLQTTPSTCGPASAATILKQFGIDATEREIARECFSSAGGTENWYLARMFHRRGFEVRYRITEGFPPGLPLPAIAGVRLGNGVGHFIPILEERGGVIVTGDPLTGRREYPADKIAEVFHFTGFYMEIRPKK